MTRKLTEGMQVLRFRDHHDNWPTTHTVTRVLKNQLVLDDGERYTLAGDKWGSGDSWPRSYILPATPEMITQMEQARREEDERRRVKAMRDAIVRFVSSDLTQEEVAELYRHLRNKGMPELQQKAQ